MPSLPSKHQANTKAPDPSLANSILNTHIAPHILDVLLHLNAAMTASDPVTSNPCASDPIMANQKVSHQDTLNPLASQHIAPKQLSPKQLSSKQLAAAVLPPQNSEAFHVLLIGAIAPLSQLTTVLQGAVKNSERLAARRISMTCLSPQAFLQTAYNQRYDLGCFIHPWLTFKPATAHMATAQLQEIAMRLRDLFAQQSLLFMPSGHAPIDLDSMSTTPVSADNTIAAPLMAERFAERFAKIGAMTFHHLGYSLSGLNKNETPAQVACWQFNLYDYKPRPHWLNARFWANPENYNKFRW